MSSELDNNFDGVFCRGCGKKIHSSAVTCPGCGAPQKQVYSGSKSKTSAILLSLFLGGLGAHKFYLGESGKGILYILFCWTFIPSILALISLIRFICMSDDDFNAKYNS